MSVNFAIIINNIYLYTSIYCSQHYIPVPRLHHYPGFFLGLSSSLSNCISRVAVWLMALGWITLCSCSIESCLSHGVGVSYPLTSIYGRRENDVDPAGSELPVGPTQICCNWITCQLHPPLHLTSFSFLRS